MIALKETHFMMVSFDLVVLAVHFCGFVAFFIIGYQSTGLAIGAQIFFRIKTKGPECPEAAYPPVTPPSQMRLATVFNHYEIIFIRQSHDLIHISRLSVQVNRNNYGYVCFGKIAGFGMRVRIVNIVKNVEMVAILDP